ncbi:hypothetical protein VFPBJ_06275 [Purpureocillium lilacinum]|uniref:Uncharacterized protein n=1 Tax=Purpureocillium lilacinum TaxID=33203 RepID=A0A179GTM4_PURLI|nr:hypothetical protein VFPBJ_06275 [Purpureocillium lilacinum]
MRRGNACKGLLQDRGLDSEASSERQLEPDLLIPKEAAIASRYMPSLSPQHGHSSPRRARHPSKQHAPRQPATQRRVIESRGACASAEKRLWSAESGEAPVAVTTASG